MYAIRSYYDSIDEASIVSVGFVVRRRHGGGGGRARGRRLVRGRSGQRAAALLHRRAGEPNARVAGRGHAGLSPRLQGRLRHRRRCWRRCAPGQQPNRAVLSHSYNFV